MINEPARGNAGPWGCPYCGTGFNAPLMICPQCGAKQHAAGPRVPPTSESTTREWHDGFARHSHTQWRPPAFSFGGAEAYNDYPSRDEDRGAERSWTPFYAIGSVLSIAFLLAAYMISHRAEREPTPGAQVVEGAVLGPNAKSPVQPATLPALHSAPSVVADVPPPATAAGHVQPPLPARPAPPAVAHVQTPPPARVSQPQQHLPPTPVVTAREDSAAQSAAARKNLAEQRALAAKANAAKAAATARTDVARNLATARASLDKNSLAPARKSIASALASQPGNGSALQMQAELASREQQRDSLLGYARLCAREGQWVCAWHNAGHALTVDSSSSEARELLSRSIAAQGAGTARQVYGGPPGPPIDDQ
jgi:hypothetical protein